MGSSSLLLPYSIHIFHNISNKAHIKDTDNNHLHALTISNTTHRIQPCILKTSYLGSPPQTP